MARTTRKIETPSGQVHVESPLLELKHRDTSGAPSRWVWRDAPKAPDAAALAACGFSGSVFVPSAGATNLLLLLHGLGDRPQPFAELARKMSLPQTAALALRAPINLPFGLEGSQWHEPFDEASGEPIAPGPVEKRRVCSLQETRAQLLRLLRLLDECGWPARRIFLLGYAQGGTAALDLSLHAACRLGGVVSVCGHPLAEAVHVGLPPVSGGAKETPVVVIAAEDDAETPIPVARQRLEALRSAFGGVPTVALRELPGRGELAESEAQMRCMMEFFAAHLELRSKALEEDPSLIRVA